MDTKSYNRLFGMTFASIYHLYIQKAERKNRTKGEVDQIILWFSGYSQVELQTRINEAITVKDFFEQMPAINPNASLITGLICGIRVEEIEDPLIQNIKIRSL